MIKMCCVIFRSTVIAYRQEDIGLYLCLQVRRKSVDTPSVLHVTQYECSLCDRVKNLLGHEAGVLVRAP